MKRCTRCILPANFPGISFDSNGICNFCYEYDRKFARIDFIERERRLTKTLDRYRNQHGRYDCILGWSGGKDSTYALYLLKERYKLRVLPFHYNNGFDRPENQANLEAIADRLNVNLVTVKHPWDELRQAYASCISAEGDFCIACVHPMLSSYMRLARSEGIRLMIIAYSSFESFPHGSVDHIVSNWRLRSLLKGQLSPDAMRLFMRPSRVERLLFRRKWIMLPDYVKWLDNDMFEVLDKLGWKDSTGRLRESDCAVFPIAEYIFMRERGWGSGTVVRANYIRAGKLSREEAISGEYADLDAGEPEELEKFLGQIGLARAALIRRIR
jgi:hypothetical protein